MRIENRVLWLARSFALSRYNHRAVIITLKAIAVLKMAARLVDISESEVDQKLILFSRIINVIILKQLVASGDVNIGKY